MTIHGIYYDGRSSRGDAAELRVDGGHVSVYVDQAPIVQAVPAPDLVISSRLGTTPRYIRFPDGAQFETSDHAAVEQVLRDYRGRAGVLHMLESRWRYLPLALLVVGVFVWWTVVYGVPWASKVVAFSLPQQSNEWIAKGALGILDRHVLQPSTLPQSEQDRLQAKFRRFLQPWQAEQPMEVLFRSGADSIGANALALPSGQIIFTDEIVQLANSDEDLLAVLAHEVGHLRERHALRQSIQNSTLTLVTVAVVGDVSALSSIAGSLPLLLTQMGYSRDFEREADDFAAEVLRDQHIDLHHFTDMLTRLSARGDAEAAGADRPSEPESEWNGYWSTHPLTKERIERLRAPTFAP